MSRYFSVVSASCERAVEVLMEISTPSERELEQLLALSEASNLVALARKVAGAQRRALGEVLKELRTEGERRVPQ